MTTNNENQSTVESMTLEEFIRRAIAEAQRSDVFVRTHLNSATSPWLFPRTAGNKRGMLIDEPTLTPRGTDGVFAISCKFSQQMVTITFCYFIHLSAETIENNVKEAKSLGNSGRYVEAIANTKSIERSFERRFPLRKAVW